MKQLHRNDLFGWSEFNPDRNLDFHSVLWVRTEGNVMFDPLPLSPHDLKHLNQLGGVKFILITNSDHCRDAFHLAKMTGAELYGPASEKDSFPFACDHWVADNQEIIPGLKAYQLNGSKTPGELAFVLEGATLITGDLIRCHVGGELCLLPEAKLGNVEQARESAKRMASLDGITTVLVGDGWPLFTHAGEALKLLANSF
jgi:Metallo-beta-lactamase superfamily